MAMSAAATKTKQLERVHTQPVMEIKLHPFHRYLTDEAFEKICAQNPDYRVEMTKEGQVIFMMPVVLDGSHRNFKLTGRFYAWAESNDLGQGFDSSAGFTLPNGAKRSPDVAWLRKERWDSLTLEQRSKFARICPDFVVELRSKTDRLKTLQAKLKEYIANGAQLGWLIDPLQGKVHIYRPDQEVEMLDHPQQLSGEEVLPGFVLRLEGILD
jgi:Uma2 family endonuclease